MQTCGAAASDTTLTVTGTFGLTVISSLWIDLAGSVLQFDWHLRLRRCETTRNLETKVARFRNSFTEKWVKLHVFSSPHPVLKNHVFFLLSREGSLWSQVTSLLWGPISFLLFRPPYLIVMSVSMCSN